MFSLVILLSDEQLFIGSSAALHPLSGRGSSCLGQPHPIRMASLGAAAPVGQTTSCSPSGLLWGATLSTGSHNCCSAVPSPPPRAPTLPSSFQTPLMIHGNPPFLPRHFLHPRFPVVFKGSRSRPASHLHGTHHRPPSPNFSDFSRKSRGFEVRQSEVDSTATDSDLAQVT